jgi:hypothetical protein
LANRAERIASMSASKPSPAPAGRFIVWACLAAALLLFAGLGFWQSRTFMVWEEETMVYSAPGARVFGPEVGPDGQPWLEPSCADPGAPRLVLSASRPRLSACFAGRSWPLMIAPYFAGFFYWPFSLLAPLHHDNVLSLRVLAMSLGAISILLTYRVVSRLADRRSALLAALVTATTPCFIVSHATLVHFETMPWIWMMAAMLCFLRCRGLAPGAPESEPIPTSMVVLGSFFVGLAMVANFKAVFMIAPLFALALRLGVQIRRVSKQQWLLLGLAMIVALIPMIGVNLAPSGGYGDKSGNSLRALLQHILEPGRVLFAIRDLLLLWSNVAFYFGQFTGVTKLNWLSASVAAAVVAYERGATILRAHDVREHVEALAVASEVARWA